MHVGERANTRIRESGGTLLFGQSIFERTTTPLATVLLASAHGRFSRFFTFRKPMIWYFIPAALNFLYPWDQFSAPWLFSTAEAGTINSSSFPLALRSHDRFESAHLRSERSDLAGQSPH